MNSLTEVDNGDVLSGYYSKIFEIDFNNRNIKKIKI